MLDIDVKLRHSSTTIRFFTDYFENEADADERIVGGMGGKIGFSSVLAMDVLFRGISTRMILDLREIVYATIKKIDDPKELESQVW